MTAASEKRQRAERVGRRAEMLVALIYALRGYQILDLRFRSHGGEIDLVARRGRTLAIIEVKARRDHDGAILAVTPAARRRIEHAVRIYHSRRPTLAKLDIRYDIATVKGWRVRLLQDAWRGA